MKNKSNNFGRGGPILVCAVFFLIVFSGIACAYPCMGNLGRGTSVRIPTNLQYVDYSSGHYSLKYKPYTEYYPYYQFKLYDNAWYAIPRSYVWFVADPEGKTIGTDPRYNPYSENEHMYIYRWSAPLQRWMRTNIQTSNICCGGWTEFSIGGIEYTMEATGIIHLTNVKNCIEKRDSSNRKYIRCILHDGKYYAIYPGGNIYKYEFGSGWALASVQDKKYNAAMKITKFSIARPSGSGRFYYAIGHGSGSTIGETSYQGTQFTTHYNTGSIYCGDAPNILTGTDNSYYLVMHWRNL